MPRVAMRTLPFEPAYWLASTWLGFVAFAMLYANPDQYLIAQERDPKLESRVNSEMEELRGLFPWLDSLSMYPPSARKLIWIKEDSQGWYKEDWPKFAVVLKDTETYLEFVQFTFFQSRRVKVEPYGPTDRGRWYREVNSETAAYLWERYIDSLAKNPKENNESNLQALAMNGLLLARFSDQNGRPDIADQVLHRMVHSRMTSHLTQTKLSPVAELRILQSIFSELYRTDIDREIICDRLTKFLVTFPTSKHKLLAEKLLAVMTAMASEDAAHAIAKSGNQDEWSEQARIDELIFLLRNLASGPVFNKMYADAMNDPRGDASPASQLASIGFPAVPALIKAIDDDRPSCCVTYRSTDEFGRPLTIGECAIFILSEISFEPFGENLSPTPMFMKAPGIDAAKSDINEWWRKYQHMSELEYLRARIGERDFGGHFYIARVLVQEYRSQAMQILLPLIQRPDLSQSDGFISLLSEEPRPEEISFFESQRNHERLSVRIDVASALLKLGKADVIDEQIAFWRRVSDSPDFLKQVTKSDSDPNARIMLVRFLASCGRPDAIDALASGMPQVEPDYCNTIMDCVFRNFGQKKTTWTDEVQPQPKPIRDASLRLLLNATLDQRVQPERNLPGVLEEDVDEIESKVIYTERVCDWAASYLTNVLSDEPRYEFQLPIEERDRRIESIRKKCALLP
jgi:hypothetical protein